MTSVSTNELAPAQPAQMSLELADKLTFQGFDPMAIRTMLRKYNPNALQLNIDIEFLVTLILSRGSNVFYKTSSLPAEIRERFSLLVGTYRIERKRSNDSNKDTVTLSRILKSFPDYAFNILKKKPDIKRPVSTEIMCNTLGYKKFPSCLCGDFVFSLVPPKSGHKNYTGIIKAVIHYQLQEAKILNSRPNKCAPPDAETLENIIHYAAISWNKTFLSTESREDFMSKTQIRQADMDAWSAKFDNYFPNFKDVGNRFGQ